MAACNTYGSENATFGHSDPVLRANHAARQDQAIEDVPDSSEKSFSATPPAPEPSKPASHASALAFFDHDETSLRPGPSDIAAGIGLYFKYCHRQPIWCFEREEVSDCSRLPEELAYSILALTSRFSDKRNQVQLHGENAKTLIMLRIANGTVEITTMESLCLLSYSSFIGMNHLAKILLKQPSD